MAVHPSANGTVGQLLEYNSNELKGKEDDTYKLFDKLLDFMYCKGCFMAKFHNISELDQFAKICSGCVKIEKIELCSAFLCYASQFSDKVEWVQHDKREDWFHMMCIGIPDCEYPQVELMDSYILCSKCCFEIVAPGIVSSACNVHIFTMFETLHSHQNMLKVLKTFESQINNMQHKDFTLPGGIKVKAFLNGDFKMSDLLMGHQASASYRSIKDLVTLKSFSKHKVVLLNCKKLQSRTKGNF